MTHALGRMTERSRKVLELALREALSLGHNYIGTQHILLGIIREGDCLGAKVLHNLGLTTDEIRNEVIRQLSGPKRTEPDREAELVERVATRVVEILDTRAVQSGRPA